MTKGKESTPLLNFEKPPVVEAWIEFDFDLSEENIPWTEENAVTFIKENFADYTPKRSEFFARIQVNSKGDPDFSKTDKTFNRIKAFSNDEQYCIQAGRNILIFNQINKGNWPGYDNMRDKAFEVLESYSDYRSIKKLLSACLHYRDVISIPSKSGKIELEDYFKIYPNLNNSFGDLSSLKLELFLPHSCTDGLTLFTLLSILGNDDKNFKFQMDWHIKPSDDSIIINYEKTREWLNKVHSDLRKRFEETFTDKAKKLFRSKRP